MAYKGTQLLTVLFLCATIGKFSVVYASDKDHKKKFEDTLTLKNYYFVKNVVIMKEMENLYEATANTSIIQSRKPLENITRYIFISFSSYLRLLLEQDWQTYS